MREAVLKQKESTVAEIKDKIEKASSMILVEYRGLNVEDVTELRKQYREAGVEYKVYKNTLMKRAFGELGYEEFAENFKGPNAIAFAYEDIAAAARVSSNFAKTHEKLVIKSGIVDGKLIELNEVKALAELPTREVLLSQVLGGLNAPIQGFANVLSGTMRSLVIALDQVRAQKEQ
ncbi:MAG: 50S ribosomal protein L10 [Ezakiella sp.]|nr:50S ribosomal protein L10 [Ezakiella sp.]MDD7472168.1 50S ribosomal protein L10 [Bacillota bacterium]MDY3923465.1 50S ribosomal protein L10 [Ezakiella sp.]